MKAKLYSSEYYFCEILWERGPLERRELIEQCRFRLDWKGSVTRTAIRRLVKRGVLKVEEGVVTPLVSQEQAVITDKTCLFDLLHGGSMNGNTAFAILNDQMAAVEARNLRSMMDRHESSNHGTWSAQ